MESNTLQLMVQLSGEKKNQISQLVDHPATPVFVSLEPGKHKEDHHQGLSKNNCYLLLADIEN